MQESYDKAFQEAVDYGIDVDLLLLNLTLTPQQRVTEHQRALDIINELEKNFKFDGIAQQSTQNSH